MGSFVKSIEYLKALSGHATTFYDAEMLTLYWETKPEIIAKLLPPPLKPAKRPLVHAFVANYPKTSFAPPYKEAGLFILADYNGELGMYCLSMPITDGMGMAMGREICGLPKKMSDISFEKNDNVLKASVSRHGIEFFNITASLNDKFNESDAKSIIDEYSPDDLPYFNVKYSKAIDGSGFDLPPTLVKQSITKDYKVTKDAEVRINMIDSPTDPWTELEVVRVLGGVYTVSTNVLLKGTVLEQIPPMTYLPYAQIKWDF
ncbi:acetoacetate decarboxylase family protein [Clostridium uliginosum]|uniref:Acetoacetate decarboxylase n=1 Tax=Clostridium uliginosum TaxID=119641 RepID=A0A1I1HAN0_9CLOT|nr:acetoacetate decarboxylase family protein [Clostridium uliginosum]SFC21024.1 acetoacetate decarboxylase [Clostridium uliginosum]